jgi:CheY-like chemotaxis protein
MSFMTHPKETRNKSLLLAGRQILVVEDDSDTREMLKFVLEQNGAAVFATDSVPPAVELVEKVHPDAVVADIGLPEYNGYALIAKIREFDKKEQLQTKCVAVTAYATPTDRDIALKSGYDAYIAKPFEPEELVQTVAQLAA